MAAGRWYVNERLEVPAYDSPAIGAEAGQCESQTLLIGHAGPVVGQRIRQVAQRQLAFGQ